MKKIFTLAAASLFTMIVFAADHRPSVTIQANKKFTVVIDGKNYFGSNAGSINISSLRNGFHTITVYKAQKSFFKRNKRVVATSGFMLRGNDVNIVVDKLGTIMMNEIKNDRKDFGWDKKGRDEGLGRDYRKDKDGHVMKDNDRHFDR